MRNIFQDFYGFIFALNCLTIANNGIAAVYYPGAIAGSGNTAALISDIIAANASSADDIIDLGGYAYILHSADNNTDGNNGLPAILDAATSGKLSIINGTIGRDFTLSSGVLFRIIHINSGAIATLFNLTLENGLIDGTDTNGGAIFNSGLLTIINCSIANNTSLVDGGAIVNYGTILSIENTIIAGNQASGVGGGIFNMGVITSIDKTSINNNQAANAGGAIYNRDNIGSISNSTISGNEAVGNGGGIDNEGNGIITSISNSTIVSNQAFLGGGIFNNEGIINSIGNTTIYNNRVRDFGGGIVNEGSINLLFSTLLAGNQAGNNPDYSGASLPNEGYNLFSSTPSGFTPSATDIIQTNASSFLGLLQNNGGPTFTVALLPGSLAINNGYNPNSLVFDQRGPRFMRVRYGLPDIGASEL